jgi:6-phosphogluconolactonase
MAMSRRELMAVGLTGFAMAYMNASQDRLLAAVTGAAQKYWVYTGGYNARGGRGICLFDFDAQTGVMEDRGVVAETPQPSFLAVDRQITRLFAVNEVSQFAGQRSGSVSSFRIDRATGKLAAVNVQPSGGQGPCHLCVDAGGVNVLVANYGSGSVASLPVEKDGTLKPPSSVIQHAGKGPNAQRQSGPHAHGVYFDPSGKFVLAPDLGLDKIMIYPFDPAAGKLAAENAPFGEVVPGSGPRHLAFSKDGRFVYVLSEMKSTVTVFEWTPGARPSMQSAQTVSLLPANFKGNSTAAEIFLRPDGKFLYGSNRGHDSIVTFTVDQQIGQLTKGPDLPWDGGENNPTGGKTPRSFAIDPTGRWLLAANQDSDSLVLFKIDARTGAISPADKTFKVPSPTCVLFVPKA